MGDAPRGRPPEKREAARAYFIEHPWAKDKDVSVALNIDKATVARARWSLIDEGLLPSESRRRLKQHVEKQVEIGIEKKEEEKKVAKEKATTSDDLLTDEDLRFLDMDETADEEVRGKMLRALRKLAFSSGVNHDTRMSAMQLWVKLKDVQQQQSLGPGAPLSYEAAKARLMDLMKACGFELVYDAFNELFVPKEPADEGKLPVDPGEDAQSTAGTAGT